MGFGSGIRPGWRRLFERGSRAGVDYSLSPVHEVVDDVEGEDGPTPGNGDPPPPVVDIVVTGITDEFASSELVFTEIGDSTVVEAN